MSDYRPIDCSVHDQIEVLCLHRSQITVALVDGTRVSGIAATTRTQSGSGEFLVLANEQEIRLDRIAAIDVGDDKSAARRIRFAPAGDPV